MSFDFKGKRKLPFYHVWNITLLLSYLNHPSLIFISSILSWQCGKGSRRGKCKMTYNLDVLTLKIKCHEALCFNLKSVSRLHGFESSWTFWKACFKGYNFHVLSFFQFKLELGEKMAWSLKKIRNFNTLNFLSIETFDFLLTFSNSLIFYDHDGSFEVFWCLKKVLFWKIWPKVKVGLFCADEFSSDDFEID